MNNAIVFTISNSYVKALEIFLLSYIAKNTLRPDCIVIEEEEINQHYKNNILKIYPKTTFVVPDKKFNIAKKNNRRNWSICPANRFSIFQIKNYEKIIFFDADMIILENIEELFKVKCHFGAVYHPHPDGMCSSTLSINSEYLNKKNILFDFSKSFNAGLMIISNKYLNENVVNDLINIYQEEKWLGNQGPLNMYFNNKVALLNEDFFISTPFLTPKNLITGKIFHFAGEKKPWLSKSFHLDDNYDKYVLDSNPNRLSLLKLLLKYKSFIKNYD